MVFTAYGRLITVGSNKFGQLGLGDFKPRTGPCVVGGEMVGKRIVQAACGDDFTVVATAGNNLLLTLVETLGSQLTILYFTTFRSLAFVSFLR